MWECTLVCEPLGVQLENALGEGAAGGLNALDDASDDSEETSTEEDDDDDTDSDYSDDTEPAVGPPAPADVGGEAGEVVVVDAPPPAEAD